MAKFDHGFKIIARESGRALAQLANVECDTWKPLESTIQATTERLADRAFLAANKHERFVVYMECVTRWDSSIPWSILGKSGLLAERERLPVVSLLFVLKQDGYIRQNETMLLSASGRPTQQVWFQEVCFWEIAPGDWWNDKPGLMALYPLSRHPESPREAVAHAAERIEIGEKDQARQADLLSSLAVFSDLAYKDIDYYSLIGRERMEESAFYQQILNEGAVKRGQIDLSKVIVSRFGKKAASSLRESINSINDAKRLTKLFDLALSCDKIDQLRAKLIK